jgi:hypothetical protein
MLERWLKVKKRGCQPSLLLLAVLPVVDLRDVTFHPGAM